MKGKKEGGGWREEGGERKEEKKRHAEKMGRIEGREVRAGNKIRETLSSNIPGMFSNPVRIFLRLEPITFNSALSKFLPEHGFQIFNVKCSLKRTDLLNLLVFSVIVFSDRVVV